MSLTENFFAKCNKHVVIPKWESYVQRKMKCEKILGRTLRASNNLMKYCCHGGKLPATLAMKILQACSNAPEPDAGTQADVVEDY